MADKEAAFDDTVEECVINKDYNSLYLFLKLN